MIDLNAPSIAVIIGAWAEHQQPIIQKCLTNIVEFIDQQPNITTVILSGNHVNIDGGNQGPNNWYTNAEQLFVTEQGVDWIRRYWAVPKPKSFATVAPLIRDHAWNRYCISIWEQWQLEYLLNHTLTQEQNIWYFGVGLGVRRDPIGWGQLSDLIQYNHVRDINILTSRQCMLNNSLDNADYKQTTFTNPDFTNTDWSLIKDDIFVKRSNTWNPEVPNGL